MTVQETLDNIVKRNNGYLRTSDVVASGISKTYLSEYVKKRNLDRVAKGVYISEDAWLDELYLIHLRNKEAVFSHETALYLYGLTEREPSRIMLTVSRGYNASHLRDRDCKVYTISQDVYSLGKTEVTTNFGNKVYAYDVDRTICDIIKHKEKTDIQVFQSALKEYMHSSNKNLPKYFEILKRTGKQSAVLRKLIVFNIYTIDKNFALVHVIQSQNQLYNSGFSCTVCSYKSRTTASIDLKR